MLNHVQYVQRESTHVRENDEIYHSGYLVGWDNLGRAWTIECIGGQEDEWADKWRRAPHFDMPTIDEITHKEPQS